MDHIPDRPPDSPDRLLAPPPLPADRATLREDLFSRTAGVLRRQRRLRALAVVAALAACYGAGLLTMRWALTPAPPTPVDRPARREGPRPDGSRAAPAAK